MGICRNVVLAVVMIMSFGGCGPVRSSNMTTGTAGQTGCAGIVCQAEFFDIDKTSLYRKGDDP